MHKTGTFVTPLTFVVRELNEVEQPWYYNFMNEAIKVEKVAIAKLLLINGAVMALNA